MRRFEMGVSEELKEECSADMVNENMDLSSLMYHAQKVEDSRLRKSNKEAKKARSL